MLLESDIFNGYWFPSVSLKHKVSSCKPYCFLNHNAFRALIQRDSNLSCACRLETVVISLMNICLSSTSSLCSFSDFLIYRPSDRVRKKMKNYAEISGNIMRKKVPIMRKRQQIMRKFPTKRSRLCSSFLKKRSRPRRSLLTKQSRLRCSFQRKVR